MTIEATHVEASHAQATHAQATHDHVLAPATTAGTIIHPLWVRLTHWINVVAMIMDDRLRLADLQRLAAVPVYVPGKITLGGWLAGRCSGTSRRCGCWP